MLYAIAGGALFLLGAWIGHAAAGRAADRAELELEHVLTTRVRVEGNDARGARLVHAGMRGSVVLIDATVRELLAYTRTRS